MGHGMYGDASPAMMLRAIFSTASRQRRFGLAIYQMTLTAKRAVYCLPPSGAFRFYAYSSAVYLNARQC